MTFRWACQPIGFCRGVPRVRRFAGLENCASERDPALPSCSDLPIRRKPPVNINSADEQIFGAKQQDPHGGQSY
jgi:hypothetical protein